MLVWSRRRETTVAIAHARRHSRRSPSTSPARAAPTPRRSRRSRGLRRRRSCRPPSTSPDPGHADAAPAAPDGRHVTYLLVAGIETGRAPATSASTGGRWAARGWCASGAWAAGCSSPDDGTGFRAEEGSALEQRAARESFASSVLSGRRPVRRARRRDHRARPRHLAPSSVAHGIASTAREHWAGQLRARRRALGRGHRALPRVPRQHQARGGPTFTSKSPGREARSTAPDGARSFVQRQGLLRLPDPGYERRPFHPRMGAFGISYLSTGRGGLWRDERTAARLSTDRLGRRHPRHRLRRDPSGRGCASAASSTTSTARRRARPLRPRPSGAPWWEEAFAAAGYARPLPRRGRARGPRPPRRAAQRDPVGPPFDARGGPTGTRSRTRVRRDRQGARQPTPSACGRTGCSSRGSSGPGHRVRSADDPVQLALARIRQLSAHEVGHTLGLSHNFAASVADRASVMDYPAPRVRPSARTARSTCPRPTASGSGAWDVHAIRMLYEDRARGRRGRALPRADERRSPRRRAPLPDGPGLPVGRRLASPGQSVGRR